MVGYGQRGDDAFVELVYQRAEEEEGREMARQLRETSGCPGCRLLPGQPSVQLLSRFGVWEYPAEEGPILIAVQGLDDVARGVCRFVAYMPVDGVDLWLPIDAKERLRVVAEEEMRRLLIRMMLAGWRAPTPQDLIFARRWNRQAALGIPPMLEPGS